MKHAACGLALFGAGRTTDRLRRAGCLVLAALAATACHFDHHRSTP